MDQFPGKATAKTIESKVGWGIVIGLPPRSLAMRAKSIQQSLNWILTNNVCTRKGTTEHPQCNGISSSSLFFRIQGIEREMTITWNQVGHLPGSSFSAFVRMGHTLLRQLVSTETTFDLRSTASEDCRFGQSSMIPQTLKTTPAARRAKHHDFRPEGNG